MPARAMNAARRFTRHLSREALLRLLARRPGRFELARADEPPGRDAATDELADAFGARHERDLAGLLDVLGDDELRAIARGEKRDLPEGTGELRAALWRHGATLEAGGDAWIGTALQPAPVLIGDRLVVLAPPRGLHPIAPALPRPVPPPAPPAPPEAEPDSIDELLAAADRTLGVRLGARGADKGAWGQAAARLLGVVERGGDEPDWRGDVEIKTVPVAPDRRGRWRVTEDPAVSMAGAAPLAKLMRVLWLCRVPLPDGDATFLSWYLLEWDAEVARLVGRYLHTRPKGGAGTRGRGWYLHKKFFADAGLLATLNGVA